MTGFARTGIKIVALLLSLVLLLTIAMAVATQSNLFKDWLLAQIAQRSGFAVRVDSLTFRPPFTLLANAVEVTKPGQFRLSAPRLYASVNPWARSVDKWVLNQPQLAVDIDGIMTAPTQAPTQIVLRELILENGALVITLGDQTVLELTKINLRLQNLNLGAQSGVMLAAEVPQLNGAAEVRVTGQPRDFDAAITLRPRQSRTLLGGANPPGE